MFTNHYRLALLALLAGGFSLAGCSTTPTSSSAASHANTSATATVSNTKSKTVAAPKSAGKALPENTGIPSCDDYLASYVACHRAAGIYAPDQISTHYQDMRDGLLRDSQDPATRPQLGARCTSLAQQLKTALHGKSCGPINPASAGTAGSR
ncbi:hypothetical protein [Dyella sp. ASV21]|uniref:hypothetical protein n=1 Tax=Dyella sp. ASV21 TaxID=2795114 RepID=UPI0018ECA6E8|nr:hypothetical protein [Dyella sp. ASV21]